jgi:hypothetical protein
MLSARRVDYLLNHRLSEKLKLYSNTYPLPTWQQVDEDEDEENATPEYRRLIAIHAGKPKGASNIWFPDPNKVRRLSLSEQELENAIKSHGSDIIR